MQSILRIAALFLLLSTTAFAAPARETKTFPLPDGSSATLGPDGFGFRRDARGEHARPFSILRPSGQSPLGGFGPSDLELQRRIAMPRRPLTGGGSVVVTFANATVQPEAQAATQGRGHVRTGDSRIDATLASIGAHRAHRLTLAPSGGLDLSRTYLLHVAGADARRAARALAATPGVLFARADLPIGSMATDLKPMPLANVREAQAKSRTLARAAKLDGVPSNFGLQSSKQAYLNSTGVNAVGAFVEIAQRFGQLPGEGTIVTNVSLGDLTDQSMADAGDFYVLFFGPTTIVRDGQRYLDFPSLPLIPTFTVAMDGTVDPLGSVEQVDPALGEVLLDFSVMAPLPHDRQRPEALGDATTDLLGIAPGAQYRLVVPQEPTMANIAVAMLAAAQQIPRPDVINASLGFPFDDAGFPGRYLEDDPVLASVVQTIVQDYGIVVCIAANDGTRIFTPAGVPPQGGSAPMDLLPRHGIATSADDIGFSTARSLIPDNGSIAVGGTTLDDIFSVQPHAVDVPERSGQFATTRYNGSGGFSTGFGTRVNISAPSDNIAALAHTCLLFFRCTPQDSVTVLSGGTSASAPMTAAAAAVVIQVSRLMHRSLTPVEVRDLLVRTGRPVPAVPQADGELHVGPQLDVTAAVEALLGNSGKQTGPAIARLAIAHRQTVGGLGGTFIEIADPANIDLRGGSDEFSSGQPLVGPITFAPDLVGVKGSDLRYVLRIGSVALESRSRSFQLFPAEILSYAGLAVVSDGAREVPVTYEVRRGGKVLASVSTRLVFGPTDGTFSEALAPTGPAAVAVGRDVRFHYDLRGARFVNNPALVVSSVNHWSPAAAPQFRIEAQFPLAGLAGEVTIPASAFSGGAGLYGVGILVDSDARFFGEFAALRVGMATADDRPEAPLLADASGQPGHFAGLTRAAPVFRVQWDAKAVGADGAILEISAAGPTLFSLANTFTNQFGDRLDHNGVDSPSSFSRKVAASGSVVLDAVQLGLASSLLYNVRILPTRHGHVIGEASPSSALELDDGLLPGGASLANFDVVAGGKSTVAGVTGDAAGNLVDSWVRTYGAARGEFGDVLAEDATGATINLVVGSDRSAGQVLVANLPFSFFGGQQLFQTFDVDTGALVSSAGLDMSEWFFLSARVDPARHRAALLAWNANDFSDNVLSVDLRSGALGAPVNADNGLEFGTVFTGIDIEPQSGRAVLARANSGEGCINFRENWVGEVDLDSGTAFPVQPSASCTTGMVSAGGRTYMPIGPLFAFPGFFPVAQLQVVDDEALQVADAVDLDGFSPFFPAIDPDHNVLILAHLSTGDAARNNNAMSGVGVYDLSTRKRLALLKTFNFVNTAFSGVLNPAGERGIQLDPATRTGWTFGPGGVQVQQFHY